MDQRGHYSQKGSNSLIKRKFASTVSVTIIILGMLQLSSASVSIVAGHHEEVHNGGQRMLKSAFDEIVHRRVRRNTAKHDQVVNLSFSTKENKSVTVLNQEEKDYLVHVHNAYRSVVIPFAAKMKEVVSY